MAAHQRFPLFVALTIFVLILAGCGGGTSLRFPPPQGSFTNANLNGSFSFSYSGSDARGFLAAAGSFQADGAGHITSGMQDINSGFGIVTNAPITGTYTVRPDGRGTANLNSPLPAGNTVIAFVLVSGGHALVTRFDANAAASGTIDQQTSTAFSNAALAGSFAFSLSGIDALENPLAAAGNFTSDATGNLTAGVNDSNDNGGVLLNDPLAGTITVGASGRGTATFNTGRGTLSFALYVVDGSHVKLIELDGTPVLAGDAFRQTGPFSNASLSGPFAFTAAGADVLNAVPFAAGGVFVSSGTGTITSGTEDFNDGGTITANSAVGGSYSMATNGRGTLSLTAGSVTSNFAIYPSSGGVMAVQTDIRFVTTGTALQQQAAPFNAGTLSGTYGLNFTGVTTNGELDSIAQFTADGASKLNGIIDVNNTGGITFGQPLSGNFTIASNGRSTVTLQTPIGTQNMVFYVVNADRALFVELDSALIAAGELRHQ